jgi:glycerol-3-phosphate acyltransferase PlsY
VTLTIILLALASYLAGSIPFGLMIGRVVKRIDLRDFGSGNIGATNVGRVLGKKWGLICLVLDALKGLLPVAFFPGWICGTNHATLGDLAVLSGVATIIGHMFPCWLGFRGGKGVATSLGVIAVLSPWGLLVAAIIFFGTFAVFRIVSLSSMLAAIGFGLFYPASAAIDWLIPFSGHSTSLGLFSTAVPLLIIIQHRGNVCRLLRGEESRWGAKPAPQSAVAEAAVPSTGSEVG